MRLSKSMSGLSVNIWVDESQEYLNHSQDYLDDRHRHIKGEHWKRIMFQADKGDNLSECNHAYMIISDDLQVIGEHELFFTDIYQLRTFIKRNKEILEALADMEIDALEFLQQMRKV